MRRRPRSRERLALVGIVAVLVGPSEWPALASVAGVDLRIGDLLIAVVVAASSTISRGRPVTRLHLATLLLIAWGLIRCGIYSTEAVSFAKTVQPLAVGLVLHRLAGGVDLGRVVRWFAGVSILTSPIWPSQYGVEARRLGLSTDRWAGIPGGPNELGLFSAALVVLAWRQMSGRPRAITVGLGVIGLLGTQSVSATIACTLALLVSHPNWRSGRRRRRLTSKRLGLAFCAAAILVFLIPSVRPDAVVSGALHTSLAREGIDVIAAESNPLFGGGWTSADRSLGAGGSQREQVVAQVHNTYIQWTADLGFIGLGLLVWWAVTLLRRLRTAPISFGLAVMVLFFLNSTGAFPSSAWGLLAVLMTCALMRHRAPSGLGAKRVTQPLARID